MTCQKIDFLRDSFGQTARVDARPVDAFTETYFDGEYNVVSLSRGQYLFKNATDGEYEFNEIGSKFYDPYGQPIPRSFFKDAIDGDHPVTAYLAEYLPVYPSSYTIDSIDPAEVFVAFKSLKLVDLDDSVNGRALMKLAPPYIAANLAKLNPLTPIADRPGRVRFDQPYFYYETDFVLWVSDVADKTLRGYDGYIYSYRGKRQVMLINAPASLSRNVDDSRDIRAMQSSIIDSIGPELRLQLRGSLLGMTRAIQTYQTLDVNTEAGDPYDKIIWALEWAERLKKGSSDDNLVFAYILAAALSATASSVAYPRPTSAVVGAAKTLPAALFDKSQNISLYAVKNGCLHALEYSPALIMDELKISNRAEFVSSVDAVLSIDTALTENKTDGFKLDRPDLSPATRASLLVAAAAWASARRPLNGPPQKYRGSVIDAPTRAAAAYGSAMILKATIPKAPQKVVAGGLKATILEAARLKAARLKAAISKATTAHQRDGAGQTVDWFDDRVKTALQMRQELTNVPVAPWNQCMSGSNATEFLARVGPSAFIGRGSFGNVYASSLTVDNETKPMVVKEALLTIAEKNKLVKNGFGKANYPDELKLLDYTQDALFARKCPNFLFVYHFAACRGCSLLGDDDKLKTGTCYTTFMERATGSVDSLVKNDGMKTFREQTSFVYQILLSLAVLQNEYGIIHKDIKLANCLYTTDSRFANTAIRYTIDGKNYDVDTAGYVFYLADFGVSSATSPKYSLDGFAGTRNYMVNGGKLVPLTTKYGLVFDAKTKRPKMSGTPKGKFWLDAPPSTSNRMYASMVDKVKFSPVVPDLDDVATFPPYEFLQDVQDVIRMTIGGARVTQPGSHITLPKNAKMYDSIVHARLGIGKQLPKFSTTDVNLTSALATFKSLYVKQARLPLLGVFNL